MPDEALRHDEAALSLFHRSGSTAPQGRGLSPWWSGAGIAAAVAGAYGLKFASPVYHLPALSVLAAGALGLAWLAGRASVRDSLDQSQDADLLRRALQAGGHAAWFVDKSQQRVYRSSAWTEMLGYQDDELGNSLESFDLLTHPEDIPAALTQRAQLESGARNDVWLEHRLRHADGSYRWMLARGRVLERDEHGSPICVAGTLTDITRRKYAEAAVEAGRKLLAAVIDLIPNAVFWKDRQGTYLGCNAAFLRMIGVASAGEVIGKNDRDLRWIDNLSDMIRNTDESVMRSGEPLINVVFESPLTSQVSAAMVSLVPMRDGGGIVNGVIGVVVDMSEQKNAERRLRESDERWSLALRGLGDAVWDYDIRSGENFYSSRWKEMLGYSDDELVDSVEQFESLIHPDDVGASHDSFRRVLSGELEVLEHEIRMRSKHHGYRWILSRGRIVARDAQGKPQRIVGTHSDVTQRHQERAEQAQARKLEAIGQLAAGIAHEINTPMQFASDSIHFVRDSLPALLNPALDPDERGYLLAKIPPALARSIEGMDRVTAIVRAMKEFSHPGHDQKSDMDLNRSLRNALTVAHTEYKYVAELTTEFGDLPPVPCLGEINQVFLNLIVNAGHAVAEQVADRGQLGRILVRTYVQGEHAVIEICDSGCGIAPDIQHRIFDPFFTTKEIGKGTGQGLAIARSIVVDKHQGSISVQSELGRGAMFTVRLPLRLARERAA